jgi:DNA-binding NarL/FixJ family response regulator
MSDDLLTQIFNAATGESTTRPMTADEIAEVVAMKTQAELEKAEAEAKATARESALAKLAALGLTADEVAAL